MRPERRARREPEERPGMGAPPEGEIWPGTGIAIDDAVEADNDEDLEPADPQLVEQGPAGDDETPNEGED